MGLLSKLFGDGKKDFAPVLDALKDAAEKGVGSLLNDPDTPSGPKEAPYRKPVSGDSWGDRMPAEENQYSFDGDYVAYFDNVLSQECASFRITREAIRDGKGTVYHIWNGDREALLVELMSERSSANRVRRDCQMKGIPYLRFYYDHPGWWNTRSYVGGRVRNALGY